MVVGAIGGVGARRWVAVGAGVGGCGEGDLIPFGVAASSAFLSLPLSLLFCYSSSSLRLPSEPLPS